MTKFIILLLLPIFSFSQVQEEISYRFLKTYYLGETVEYVVQSKKGEETMKKPLIFLCQGSLPQPLFIEYENEELYPIFLPFDYQNYLKKYHIVVVAKPGIPIRLPINDLASNYTYLPSDNLPPKEYLDNDNLNYYTNRNLLVLKELFSKNWVIQNDLVVIGHSEGSYVAVSMATKENAITKVIYSGGNPMGRIMSLISQNKIYNDSEKDSEDLLDYWTKSISGAEPDNNLNSFSDESFLDKILSLKIPVFVTYGSKDWNSIFNDYLRTETIRRGLDNFSYKIFYGTDHNFFPVDNCYENKKEDTLWQGVGDEWLSWINNN